MNKISVKLNNHYIPATYLYAFSDQRFKRKNKRMQPINTFNKQNMLICNQECINHTATRRGFYVNEITKKGENPNSWEDNHNKEAESSWFDEVFKPLDIEEIANHAMMKEKLLLHIANQATRTPLFYDETICLEKLGSSLGIVWKHEDYENSSFKHLKNEYMELVFSSFIKYLKGTTREGSNWTILRNEQDIPFYTSDNPVILFSCEDEPYEITKDDYYLYFPLSSKMMLRINSLSLINKRFDSDRGIQRKDIIFEKIDENEVKRLNDFVIKYAYREIYTSAETLITSCSKNNCVSPVLNCNVSISEIEEIKKSIHFDRDDSWYSFYHKDKNVSEGVYNGSRYPLNLPLVFKSLNDIGRGGDPYVFDESEFIHTSDELRTTD